MASFRAPLKMRSGSSFSVTILIRVRQFTAVTRDLMTRGKAAVRKSCQSGPCSADSIWRLSEWAWARTNSDEIPHEPSPLYRPMSKGCVGANPQSSGGRQHRVPVPECDLGRATPAIKAKAVQVVIAENTSDLIGSCPWRTPRESGPRLKGPQQARVHRPRRHHQGDE